MGFWRIYNWEKKRGGGRGARKTRRNAIIKKNRTKKREREKKLFYVLANKQKRQKSRVKDLRREEAAAGNPSKKKKRYKSLDIFAVPMPIHIYYKYIHPILNTSTIWIDGLLPSLPSPFPKASHPKRWPRLLFLMIFRLSRPMSFGIYFSLPPPPPLLPCTRLYWRVGGYYISRAQMNVIDDERACSLCTFICSLTGQATGYYRRKLINVFLTDVLSTHARTNSKWFPLPGDFLCPALYKQ